MVHPPMYYLGGIGPKDSVESDQPSAHGNRIFLHSQVMHLYSSLEKPASKRVLGLKGNNYGIEFSPFEPLNQSKKARLGPAHFESSDQVCYSDHFSNGKNPELGTPND